MNEESFLSEDKKKMFRLGRGIFGFSVETYSITDNGGDSIIASKDSESTKIFTDYVSAKNELAKRKNQYDNKS